MRPFRAARRFLWLVLIAVLPIVVSPKAEGAESQQVVITFAAPEAEREALDLAVREALSHLGLRVNVQRADAVDANAILAPTAGEPALARIWIDLLQGRVILYVVDGPWERVLVRLLTREPNNPAIDHERVSQILRASVQALQEGARIGISREQARRQLSGPALPVKPPLSPQPIPKRRAPARSEALELGVGAQYELQTFTSDSLSHAVGAELLLSNITGARLGVELQLTYRSLRLKLDETEAQQDVFAPRLLLDRPLRAWGGPRLVPFLGGGVDVLHLSPSTRASTLLATRERTLLYPVLRTGLLLDQELTQQLKLRFGLIVDAFPADIRFGVQRGDGSEHYVRAWPVRPGISLGIFWMTPGAPR